MRVSRPLIPVSMRQNDRLLFLFDVLVLSVARTVWSLNHTSEVAAPSDWHKKRLPATSSHILTHKLIRLMMHTAGDCVHLLERMTRKPAMVSYPVYRRRTPFESLTV